MSSLVSEEFCKPRAYKSVNSSETFYPDQNFDKSENSENRDYEGKILDGCEIS